MAKGVSIYHRVWDDQKAGFIWGFVYNLALYSEMFPQVGGQQGDAQVKHITCARVQQHLAWSKFM